MLDMNYLLNIICGVVILAALYVGYLLLNRKLVNRRLDRELGIVTGGIRSWGRGSCHNRTESTQYLALNSFADNYKMSSDDSLVDFGAGKGRVIIFIHDRFKISVTGIELHEISYGEAIDNVNSYLGNCFQNGNSSKRRYKTGKKLTIEKGYAEEYRIKEKDNKFFFFNPFDVDTFKLVVANIIESSDRYNKEVDIILYYPLSCYVEFLINETGFVLVDEIKYIGSIGSKDRFQIYRLTPQTQ